jgi:hypothetical protein
LRVRVKPGARKDAVRWEEGRGWRVEVHAPPVDGKANDHLCAWLSREVLGVAVRVRAGASGRDKLLDVEAPAELWEARMRAAAGAP